MTVKVDITIPRIQTELDVVVTFKVHEIDCIFNRILCSSFHRISIFSRNEEMLFGV